MERAPERHMHALARVDRDWLPTVSIGGTDICRIIIGTWQLSGGFGDATVDSMVHAMMDCYEHGYTTFDLSPTYGGSEEVFGVVAQRLERQHGEAVHTRLHAFTKWPVFEWRHLHIGEPRVHAECERARLKLKVPVLAGMQLFWAAQQHSVEDSTDAPDTTQAMCQALQHMAQMQLQGSLRTVSVCNFNLKQLQQAAEAGVQLTSNQVQWSLIDQRPTLGGLAAFCSEHNIHILAQGTLCGGLISEKYLNAPEPKPTTPALGKYLQMVKLWGGWELFQQLLGALKKCARKYGVSISNVATRAVLQQPVAAVIIGQRLGASDSSYLVDNARIFEFELDEQDLAEIAEVTDQARDMLLILGDCGDEYRSGGSG